MGTVTVSDAAELLLVSERRVRMLLESGELAGRRDGWRWEVDSEALNAVAAQRASGSRKGSEARVAQVPRTRTTQQQAQPRFERRPAGPPDGGVARLLELEREKCRILASEVARLANALAALGIGADSLEECPPEKVEASREREPWISGPLDVQLADSR